jgi:uncharacterized protein (TIGR02145 family)/uncharacterized repeat protein (TIGR02543 family)
MTEKQARLALCAVVITVVAIIATIVGCGGNGNPGGGDDRFTTFTLTTGAEPAIGGTVSRDPHATNYQNGTVVTLTVNPAAGYQFVGWSDESIPAISPTTITIVRNTALIAKFEPIPIDHHTLTVDANPAIGGTVSREPDAASYAHGTEVAVTATPAEGYRFINWSGASTSETQEVTVTVNNNMTLTANFELIGANVHTLTVNASPAAGGMVSRNPDAPSYTHGTEVTVTAPPAEGYTFTNWSGASTSTNAEVKVTMNANLTLTANFLQISNNHHALVTQITPDNGGIIRINNMLPTGITTHGHGMSVDISAAANPGFRFVNWTIASGTATFGDTNSENTTIALTSNTIIRANFVRTYVLTIDRDPIAGGTVTPASELNHDVNTPISITATASSGYRFVNWTVTSGTARFDNANRENTTVTLTSNTIIRANFVQLFITGSFTDLRDNQTYRTITIGTQTWMAENLNWAGDNGNLGSCYNNSLDSCAKYGRLYNWSTVMNGSPSSSSSPSGVRGICPVGWHVPSDAEWYTLTNFVGSNAGAKLKSTTGWHSGGNGTDDFGFSALPGGSGNGSGSFNGVGNYGYWWSATEGDASYAWGPGMDWGSSNVGRNSLNETNLYSLRCLEDVRP